MNYVFCVFEEEWNYEGSWIRLQSIHQNEASPNEERNILIEKNKEAFLQNNSRIGIVYYVQPWVLNENTTAN